MTNLYEDLSKEDWKRLAKVMSEIYGYNEKEFLDQVMTVVLILKNREEFDGKAVQSSYLN